MIDRWWLLLVGVFAALYIQFNSAFHPAHIMRLRSSSLGHYEPNLKLVGMVCCVNAKPPCFSIIFDSLAALR